ncbi:hypothetical protein ACH5RR_032665 [Cinchona calisaya]|uniref:3'-5' exonuclease n=1 Tax=Cinchona calisaya TaxID=153742 RepID=A0ABD2YIS3_9GENT
MGTSLTQEFPDWELPFTDEELQAIDDVVLQCTSTTTSSSKRHVSNNISSDPASDDSQKKSRRRLPDSLFIFNQNNNSNNSKSLSISPCHRRNRFPYYAFRHSSPSNYQGNMTMRYPEMAFRGRIVYSRSFDEVEKSAKELLSFVEAKKRKGGQAILGFDIEWRPTFRRGVPPGKAAVMQICGDNNLCYVFHIIHSGISQSLKYLLENPTSVKVGVCIANDAFKIFQDHNVSVKALEDLSDLANHKLGGDCKKWSLSSLTEMLICKQLPKPNKIRLGNWEADVLSKEKLNYAATDAFVSWYLYEVLQTLPEAENNKIEESVVVAP